MNYFPSSNWPFFESNSNQVHLNQIWEKNCITKRSIYNSKWKLLLKDIIHRNLIEILPQLLCLAKTEIANGDPSAFLRLWAPDLVTCTLQAFEKLTLKKVIFRCANPTSIPVCKGLKDGLRLNVPQRFCGLDKWIPLFFVFCHITFFNSLAIFRYGINKKISIFWHEYGVCNLCLYRPPGWSIQRSAKLCFQLEKTGRNIHILCMHFEELLKRNKRRILCNKFHICMINRFPVIKC